MRTSKIALLIVMLFQGVSRAVLVYDGTAANLAAPTDDPGWDAVATISGSSGPATAVFLGNNGGYGWFLTASHVNLANSTLSIGGGSYTVFSGIDQIGTADLKVFRVDSLISGVQAVTLASTTPNVGASLTMIGNGATGTKVTWNTSSNPWTSPGTGAEGYTWSSPNVKRWGTNSVLAKDITLGTSTVLATDFDAVAGEAQGSLGDSGGAVFRKSGLNWQLTALIIAVGRVENNVLYGTGFAGEPGSTSVAAITGQPNNKSVTYSVQIADYRSDIIAAIPEPSATALLFPAAFAVLAARRRRSGGDAA